MARQQPTSAELMQVQNDFETFFLPFDASLDLGTRTTYGTTDPDVDLSMVNIRHLNNTRGFRGTWAAAPQDGNDDAGVLAVPYQTGQVVVGSNNIIYQLTGTSGTMDPTTDSTNWTSLGVQLTVERAVDVTTTGGPGLISTNTNGVITLQMRGYTMGNGVSISTEGEISVTNFSLTDVHTFTTVALRNSANTIEWHTGDVAIVSTGVDPDNTGRGTYVYTGTINGNDYTGTTVDEDWTLLALPGNVVTMLGTRTGVITIANVIQDINDGGSQILTDAEYTANAFKYSGAGTPATTNPSAAGRTITSGDIYVDTTNDNFYFYSDDAWFQANPATLDDVGDVYLTNPQLDHHLVYSPNAGGTGVPGWHNQTPTAISGRNIPLEDLMDVTVGTLAVGDLLQRNAANTAWINITIDQLRAQFGLTNLNDVNITTPVENNLIQYNDTTNMWENVTPQTVAGQLDIDDLRDVTAATANSEFLQWNGTAWTPVLLSAAAEGTGTAGIAIENLNNVVNTNLEENDILVYNIAQGGWHPQSPAETAVAQLDDVGDVATYTTTTTSYIEQAVQAADAVVSAGNVVNIRFGAALIDGGANPQNVFFVPNVGFVSNAGRTSITETTFNNANAVGPYNLVQVVGDPEEYFITPAFADATAANAARDAINDIAGNAVAVTQQTGPAHPPIGSIIHWVQTNEITGAGEWRYEVLSTHTNANVRLEDLSNVADTAPAANNALVYNSVTSMWEPRTENTFQVREVTYDPLTGSNVQVLDLTRTVVSTRAADTTAPNVTRTGTAGNYTYSIRTDSTDARTTREVQSGDFYVAGNRDLYFGSIDASDNLVFREVLHPESMGGGTLQLSQLPTPSDRTQRQFIRWNPLANNNMGAWEITDEDETSLTTIFDIGDVDRRLDGANPQYTFPDGNVISGSRTNAATLIQNLDVNVTFTTTSTGLDSIQPGDRIAFWNEVTGPTGRNFQDNGGQGFVVQTINHESPIMMTIHSPDNMPISSTTVRDLAGQLRVVTATVTGTTGTQSPLFNGDILQYNATNGAWENRPIGISGAITTINAGDIGPDGESTNTATQMVNVVGGEAYIEDVTIARSGVMSPDDKIKLDNLPEAPTTIDGDSTNMAADNQIQVSTPEQHYALGVDRIAATGDALSDYSETWVNISDLIAPGGGGNLVFTDAADTNSTQLTGYRQSGTLRSVISANTNGNIFRLQFGVFTPTLNDLTQSLPWDVSTNRVAASVTNPPGVDQFISSVRAITLDSGNSQTLSDFTPGAMTPTAGPDVDWTQNFDLTTGNIFDSNTGATGGTTIATVSYNERTGTEAEIPYTTDTANYTINWGNVSAGNPVASNFGSYNFYESRNTISISQSISGLQNASNGSITWTRGAGITGGTLTGTNRLDSSFTLGTRVYKDNRQIAADATVTSVVNATRPATVTGTQYVQSLNTGTSNRPTLGTPIMPFFRLNTTGSAVVPTAYGTAAPAILTGDFTTGDGLTLNSGITRQTTIGGLGFTANVGTDANFPAGFYWFGRRGSTAPTLTVNTGLGDLTPTGTVTETVAFSRAAMTGSNVPAEWTTVNYTFIGVSINAGQTTVIVS